MADHSVYIAGSGQKPRLIVRIGVAGVFRAGPQTQDSRVEMVDGLLVLSDGGAAQQCARMEDTDRLNSLDRAHLHPWTIAGRAPRPTHNVKNIKLKVVKCRNCM
ncbi:MULTISPECIES: hypothetical protein [unclassified Azospirillum]|uniref:hypothetical protein n=1 Tax=unclassified Azospirillum TaxID=2630922 RepID=UPI0011775D06|nr:MULTISPECIES: hypothetical protein [unclassified Azospirillum]